MQLSDTVTLDTEGDIALICIDNPPVNAAGVSVRNGLVAAVEWLADNPQIEAAGLYAQGRTFVAGADIREFGKPPLDPWLPDVCQILEDSACPIVCILHGTTLGGGLEIAMGCHARLALPGAKLGLPEVHLGIIPGAGGTQRMPRLTGQAFAIEAITSGRHIPLDEALNVGIVDDRATGDTPRDAARNAANAVCEGALRTRATGALSVTPDEPAQSAARDRIRKTHPLRYNLPRCVDAVALSTQPIKDGMAGERVIYNDCHDTPQRAALIHAFFAERAVAKTPEANATPRPTDSIGVIGAGTMGAGIASACLLSGLSVTLVDTGPEALAKGLDRIHATLDGAVERGKLPDKAAALSRLTSAQSLDALHSADLIIEAAFEDMAVKQSIFRTLDEIAKSGAVLASNTSYLDINAIAAVTKRPQDVLGLHFFSPAHIMRLCEVIVAAQTHADTAATGFALAKKLRKVAVRSGVCDGFIGNRILRASRKAVEYMVLDGAAFDQIDRAIEAAGWAMGPFRVSDMAGLDIAWAQRKRLAPNRPAQEQVLETPDTLCMAGQFGRKTGAGYYLDNGTPNPAALSALAAERTAKSIAPATVSDDAIVERYITAMIMEATTLLDEGIALKASDIDVVQLFGYGFPRHLGGPMHQADAIGAAALIDRIQTYAQTDPTFWRVPSLLQTMALSGDRFTT